MTGIYASVPKILRTLIMVLIW